ncbi:hypothetical protein MMC26_001732 [Xylographa opegraphella]|nr:hypothetical protein [Xylographa opegraphella]
MAYALSTTKRKFHRILDSISNSSTTSLTPKPQNENGSATTLTQYPAKKARIVRPASVYATSTTQTESSEPIKSSSDQTTPLKKRPPFTPWDREDFLRRLETFRTPYLWMTKPDKVNEVQWARRGWICVGKDRVACSACRRELVMILEPDEPADCNGDDEVASGGEDWRSNAQTDLVEQYASMIITAHDEGCLWRRRGCDATIQRLNLTHPATTLEALRTRYESFARLKIRLPTSVRAPASLPLDDLSKQFISFLQQPLGTANLPDNLILNKEALMLALFGWQAETEHDLKIATCNACFRRLGLWLYLPKENTNGSFEVKEPIMSHLDLIEEHRLYCPWVNVSSQNGDVVPQGVSPDSTGLAGWEILAKVVQNTRHTLNDFSDNELQTNTGSPSSANTHLDKSLRDAHDQERWAKIRKLKQVFRVKRAKGAEKDTTSMPHTAS